MKLSYLPNILLALISFSSYAEEVSHPGAQIETLVRSTQDWNGSDLPQYSKSSPEVTVLKYIIPPHAQLPIHKHPFINAAYVASGEITVIRKEDDERSYERTFKQGEVIVEMVDQWHYGVNRGQNPVELIVFYAGTPNQALAIKQDPIQ